MTEERVQRRLAAILAADVVGYSALMQRAEEATYAEFERLKRELIEPSLCRHEGRLIKTTGDGALGRRGALARRANIWCMAWSISALGYCRSACEPKPPRSGGFLLWPSIYVVVYIDEKS
jgi:class 3 adenylate cyclase